MVSNTNTGTITTQNLLPAGVATAASAVEVTCNESSGLSIQVTGTYTGALTLQGTIDGSTWITLGGLPLINVNTGGSLASITSALTGIFQANVASFLKARVTALAAVTGTATVTLIATAESGASALASPIPAGANLIGSINLATSAGLGFGTYHTVISAGSVNSTLVKSSNGCIGQIHAYNFAAYIVYLKLYNKASAPTVGTDTPVFVFPIPPSGSINISPAMGIRLFTGIGYGLTKDLANSGTTAVLANDVVINIAYT